MNCLFGFWILLDFGCLIPGMDVSAAGKVCLVNTVEENSLVGEWNREWVEKASPDQ